MDQTVIETVRGLHRLSDIAGRLTKLKRSSGGFIGKCPFHLERTPSFHVRDDRGTFKCFGCGEQGDIFDFVMLSKGIGFQDAVAELQGSYTPSFEPSVAIRRPRELGAIEDEKRRISHAHGIWMKREPVHGTLASRYLRETRGIHGVLPDVLGHVHAAYCSVFREETPALIAPLQDSAGHVTAVQLIYLCRETVDAWRDGDGKRIKRTLGVMRDGCVRLGLPDTTLGLAGSVEDALAASLLFSLPVWATCGEQRFERVWVPPEIERLVIFADSDEAGMAAAIAAERKHCDRRDVVIHAPEEAKDWTAVLEERAA